MSPRLEELLEMAEQSLAELVRAVDKSGNADSISAVEQSLAEMVGALQALAARPSDAPAIVRALQDLRIETTVNVQPTPFINKIDVHPAAVSPPALPPAFGFKIVRREGSMLADRVQFYIGEAPPA